MGRPIADVAGQRFGRLVVLKRIPSTNEQARWLCQCDCGKTAEANGQPLRSGRKRSCGCLIQEAHEHKRRNGVKRQNFPEYCAWSQAKARCYDVNHFAYKDYGARGITMSDAWLHNFRQFLADIGNRPTPKYTLDRIDNNGPYAADNCRWATMKEQANNRRGNVRIEWRGESKTCREWALLTGLPHGAIYQRLAKGWPVERALTQPLARH